MARSKYEQKVAEHIAAVVAKHQIEDVLHFTRLDCLLSILKVGLRTRSELTAEGMRFTSPRRDGEEGAVSVSISTYYPKMFDSKRRDARNSPFAILVLHPSVLWDHPSLFYRYSVLSSDTAWERGVRHGGWALQTLFDDDGAGLRKTHNLPCNFPTFSESEVQVMSPIHPSYIKGVWVETPAQREELRAVFDSQDRHECVVVDRPFVPRIDGKQYAWG